MDNCFKAIRTKFRNACDHASSRLEVRDSLRILVDTTVAANCFSDDLIVAFQAEVQSLIQENPENLSKVLNVLGDRIELVKKDNNCTHRSHKDEDPLAAVRGQITRIRHDEVLRRYDRLKQVVEAMRPEESDVIQFPTCGRRLG